MPNMLRLATTIQTRLGLQCRTPLTSHPLSLIPTPWSLSLSPSTVPKTEVSKIPGYQLFTILPIIGPINDLYLVFQDCLLSISIAIFSVQLMIMIINVI